MIDIYAHQFPGRKLCFELSAPELQSSQENAAAIAVEALALFFGDLVSPLSADLVLSYFNAELSYPIDEPLPEHPFRFLRLEDEPSLVELAPAWVNAKYDYAVTIDTSILLGWIIQALKQEQVNKKSSDDSMIIGWREILIRAIRERLPYEAEEMHEDTVKIRLGSHFIEYPLERIQGALYVSGPLKGISITAPLDLRITNETGVLTLTVNIHWSLWTDPQQKGWEEIGRAVKRLQGANWKCTYSEIKGLCE